jgi:bacterioferritin-associated ferredoxin
MIRIDTRPGLPYDGLSWRRNVYICICHGITDKQIRSCVNAGARTLCELRGQLGVATQCGSCESSALAILDETLDQTLGARSVERGDPGLAAAA